MAAGPGTVTRLVESFNRDVNHVALDHHNVDHVTHRVGNECGEICKVPPRTYKSSKQQHE